MPSKLPCPCFPPKRIFVPMDYSKPAYSALRVAMTLARRWGSTLDVIFIELRPTQLTAIGPYGMSAYAPIPSNEGEISRERKRLRKAVAGFPRTRTEVRTISGWPSEEIARIVARGSADMIVMGTHGYSGIARALLGSVAEAVMRNAKVPVLAVREGSPNRRPLRIMVPCNLTPYANQGLAYAAAVADDLRAQLSVLYVPPKGDPHGDFATPTLRNHLDAVIGSKRARSIKVEIRQGHPRSAIIEVARKGEYDLLVLSAHRRGFWVNTFAGSSVERTLRHAELPNLSVPETPPARRR
ncbi:MAG: universal stress protein [Elusimicrobia bacterium]|nr:universal stress protein [Elusimicrobiota bacterium]